MGLDNHVILSNFKHDRRLVSRINPHILDKSVLMNDTINWLSGLNLHNSVASLLGLDLNVSSIHRSIWLSPTATLSSELQYR